MDMPEPEPPINDNGAPPGEEPAFAEGEDKAPSAYRTISEVSALLDVPREQYEAAELDGANAPQRFRYVTLPNLVPVLIFALVTGVIAALQYFTEAAVASGVASGKAVVGEGAGQTIGYPDDSLLTFTQWIYVRGFSNFQLGYASALAVLLFVVAALFLVLLLGRVKAFTPEEAQG